MIQTNLALPDFAQFAAQAAPAPSIDIVGSDVSAASAPLPSFGIAGPVPSAPAAVTPASAAALLQPSVTAPEAPRHGFGVENLAAAIGPLAALALALSGHPNAATGAAQGAIYAAERQRQERERQAAIELQRQREQRLEDEQNRIRAAQAAAAQAEAVRQEQARQQRIGAYITDASKTARQFKTKADYDAFIEQADQLAAGYYGARPGAVRSAVVPFVPPPVQERARQVLDRYDKLIQQSPDGTVVVESPVAAPSDVQRRLDARRGQTAGDPAVIVNTPQRGTRVPLDRLTVSFDIDGDGKPEQVTYRDLQQLAGVAMYDAAGNRVTPVAPRVPTFGEVFPASRGSVLADKPLPTTGKGAPDYSRAITDLRGLNLLPSISERTQARADAQQHARDELYAAMLEPGATVETLAPRFSDTFSKLGLTFRAEIAKVQRQLFTLGRQTVGPDDLPPDNPAGYVERGRQVLGGNAGNGAAVSSAPVVPSRPAAAGGRGARPGAAPTTGAPSDARLRAAARSVLLQEAQRRGQAPSSITDDVVSAFLNTPGNREKLQGMVGR